MFDTVLGIIGDFFCHFVTDLEPNLPISLKAIVGGPLDGGGNVFEVIGTLLVARKRERVFCRQMSEF